MVDSRYSLMTRLELQARWQRELPRAVDPRNVRAGMVNEPDRPIQSGAMPLSASSLIAVWFLARWVSLMPRRTCGALVN